MHDLLDTIQIQQITLVVDLVRRLGRLLFGRPGSGRVLALVAISGVRGRYARPESGRTSPTTTVDGTVQSKIMAILDDLRRDYGLAVLFILPTIPSVRSSARQAAREIS